MQTRVSQSGGEFKKLGAIISKEAKWGDFKILGDFETYTRYSWVADEMITKN